MILHCAGIDDASVIEISTKYLPNIYKKSIIIWQIKFFEITEWQKNKEQINHFLWPNDRRHPEVPLLTLS